ncbi:MAG: hypothetical protein Kow0080_18880 [Candidatus Promineifilaceae bacterium]
MPTSTIPYDPSLVLGMIVDPSKITELEAIADLQKPVDAERDHFNALLRQKLSLDMTMRELVSLGATPDQLKDLKQQIDKLMGDVTKTAGNLGKAVIKAEAAIAKAKSSQGQKQISSQLQSPIDFAASQLQSMPLSADTMNMDVQYFRYESNEQSSRSTANSISTFVGTKVTEFLGPTYGASVGASAHQASTSAYDNHGVFGTLVICANCTSREAQIFSPLKLDPDAAVESYVFSGKDSMPVADWQEMKKLALADISKDDQKSAMPVIVGASYGSSFVGFVHFEKTEATSSSQSSASVAAQARAEVETDLFFSSITGSFGLDAQSASSLQQLLSTSNIQSHCSLITMGLIPSIKSNSVSTAVKALQGDPKSRMEELAAMQDASNSGISSLAAAGAAAKKGQSMEQMKSDYIKSSVAAVGELDRSNNQVIDLNSLMTALDDYVAKAGDGKTGVPINYYLKYVTKRDIALEWMQKYYPNELHEKVDDNGSS